MAVNPKTQLIKLGIGTLSVVAIVGATGLMFEASAPAEQPTQVDGTAEAGSEFIQQWPSFGGYDDDDHYEGHDDDDDDDDDDEHEGAFRLARPGSPVNPGSQVQPTRRARTRRS